MVLGYIIVAVVVWLILITVVSCAMFTDDHDFETVEIGPAISAYVLMAVVAAIWPITLGVALIIGFFYGLVRVMFRAAKVINKKVGV